MRLIRSYYRYYNRRSILDELIFFITYRCNFRCKTCFYANYMNNSMTNNTKELSINEISRISSSLGRLSRLLISGGEPFLRSDLDRICQIFYVQNKISFIHLPTNGFDTEKIYDFTCKILDKCPRVNLTISLPLDGFSETHDEIKGVRGSFEKVIKTAEALADLKKTFNNFKIHIITVVNNKNVDEIIELCKFVKANLPVDGHGPSPMRGMPYDKYLSAPSHKAWNNLALSLIEFHRYWNKKGSGNRFKAFLSTNRAKYLYKVYERVLKDKRLPFRCQAGNIIAVLEPNGDIKLCELTQAVGNVRDESYDLKRILFSDKANDMREKIRKCACTHACFLDPSIKMNPLTLFKSYFWG